MLISIFCESHTMANFVSTGAFYPMIVLCGLLWPLEGMPQVLRDFALLLPFTIPTISVRMRKTIQACQKKQNYDSIHFPVCYRFTNPSVFYFAFHCAVPRANHTGAEYFNQRNANHKSKCLQWFHRYILVDCGILLLVFGRFTAKEVEFSFFSVRF